MLTNKQLDELYIQHFKKDRAEHMRDYARAAIDAALRAQADAQPIYQLRRADGSWIDQTERSYLNNQQHCASDTRIVYTHPAPEAAKPVAWVRFTSDGGYEGPIMDCDRRIDDVRRKSGAWTPLFTRAPEAAQALSAKLEEIDRKALAGLCQMSHEGARAFLKEIREIIASAATVAEPSHADSFASKAVYAAAIAGAQQAEPVGDERAAEMSDRDLFKQYCGDMGWKFYLVDMYVPSDADNYTLSEIMKARWDGFKAGRSFIPAPKSAAQSGQRAGVAEDAARFVFLVEGALATIRGDVLTPQQKAMHDGLNDEDLKTLDEVRARIDAAMFAAAPTPAAQGDQP